MGRAAGVDSGEWTMKFSTFNVLCPPYKRMPNVGGRESEYPEVYNSRLRRITDLLSSIRSDVVCLQEYWIKSAEVTEMYRQALDGSLSGYRLLGLKRTEHWSQRDDGLAFLVGPRVKVLDVQEILFQDCGDRVALLMFITVDRQPVIVINTHLLFPHSKYSTDIRLREVRKMLCFLDTYTKDTSLEDVPVVIGGDFNGSPSGKVGSYMRSQDFKLCCGDSSCWISHKSHRDNELPCDLIWLLNPSKRSNFSPQDWKDGVFSEISDVLRHRNLTLSQSFKEFFDQDSNDFVSPDEFRRALRELGFHGEGKPHLLDCEIDALLESADIDHNGKLDYKEFIDRFWMATEDKSLMVGLGSPMDSSDIQFLRGNETTTILEAATPQSIIDAIELEKDDGTDIEAVATEFYPKEIEHGVWPRTYDLSDHGLLSTTFRLVGS